jgi:formate hydrogenlyase transcriptional activator
MKAQSWGYEDVAALPLLDGVADHLHAAVRKLTAILDVQGVCEAVLIGVESVFGATSSWIMLHDPGAGVLRTALFRGRGADAYADVEIPVDCGVAGLVFTRAEIHFVPDASQEHRWFNPDRVRASGLRSVFVLPLVIGGNSIGILGLDSPQFGPVRAPTPADVKWLEVFAAHAAIGLVNARLYQSSQQDRARLRGLLRERRILRQQVLGLRDEIRHAYSFGPIVGESAAMKNLLTELQQVAGCDVTALLQGETGTGKELFARALHERSSRASHPFVPVNCAALPEHLVESELFGHERGSFTGALARKPGKFELAHRGTLFLDEIGDLPLNAQAKLLRVLQDGEVHRVGSTQSTKVDVRIVAATNQDLSALVSARKFRDDLFYRLSVFPMHIPPLRDRGDDVRLLAVHLAAESAKRMRKRLTGIHEDALAPLSSYTWPGNVRELQNVIERAVILATDGVITADDISLNRVVAPAVQPPAASDSVTSGRGTLDPRESSSPTLADAERVAIISALRQAEGRISGAAGAAAFLGLKPTTLHAKMKKLGVRRGDALHP